jgi:hypothetical protein
MTKNNFAKIRSFLGKSYSIASRDSKKEHALLPIEESVGECSPVVVNVPGVSAGVKARNILHLLRPCNVVGGSLIRKGRVNDGGYIMLDYELDTKVAYSLGIGDDVSWDLDMASIGCQVWQYDNTIESLPMEHPRFHWKKIGIASVTGDGMMSLPDIIRETGHSDKFDMILKMDIEGTEWSVFSGQDNAAVLPQFSQIVIELHKLIPDNDARYENVIAVLARINETHQCIHVHPNNWGYLGIVGGVMIPDTLEVTYVRRGDHEFERCDKTFPTELDMSCRPEVPDYFLGAVGCTKYI